MKTPKTDKKMQEQKTVSMYITAQCNSVAQYRVDINYQGWSVVGFSDTLHRAFKAALTNLEDLMR